MDLLFFTVGYGKKADEVTLERMARIFNKGLSVLSIGKEMCQLYNRVDKEDELVKVFTLFEKLFKYQTWLIDTKNTQIQELKEQMEKTRDSSIKVYDKIFESNKTMEDNELKNIKKY